MDERIKSSIEKVAVKLGDDVADAFGKKVRAVLDDVNEASGRISIPLDVAAACMLTLLFTFLNLNICIKHNKNDFLNIKKCILVLLLIFFLIFVAYLRNRKLWGRRKGYG